MNRPSQGPSQGEPSTGGRAGASAALPEGVPEGAVLESISIAEVAPADDGGTRIELLSIPADGGELPASVAAWIDADPGRGGASGNWMSFQGARVHWSNGRAAILAPADRLEAVRGAVIETSRNELALRTIERALEASWPALESDAPLAFEFDESSVGRRDELRARLQRILLLRARLARIAPFLLAPSPYPPTLASQVAERLRERLRMASRHEAASDQLDVLRETYEMCGQRASDFMLARTGHRLEWVIIVLLSAQLLLWLFEYLSAATG